MESRAVRRRELPLHPAAAPPGGRTGEENRDPGTWKRAEKENLKDGKTGRLRRSDPLFSGEAEFLKRTFLRDIFRFPFCVSFLLETWDWEAETDMRSCEKGCEYVCRCEKKSKKVGKELDISLRLRYINSSVFTVVHIVSQGKD